MKKITIIEDDTDIRNMITKFLINQKYEVCSAPNGKEGIELCKRILPDIIILDLMLPALSGDNVLKQLSLKCKSSFWEAGTLLFKLASILASNS